MKKERNDSKIVKMTPKDPKGLHGGFRWEHFSETIDEQLLKGPQPFRKEIVRGFRIFFEYLRAAWAFLDVKNCVTVFGSARFEPGHHYYDMAYDIGQALAKSGFTVMTGGGPGVMEAANRGAKEAGGKSLGCNIEIPVEQSPNVYLDQWITFKYFFVRKMMLTKYSSAFIVMPGGVGTMDELFQALTLIQTKKVTNFPVVLIGTDYYKDVIELFDKMCEEQTISETDKELFLITDSIDEAISHIQTHAVEKFNLNIKKIPKKSKLLFE